MDPAGTQHPDLEIAKHELVQTDRVEAGSGERVCSGRHWRFETSESKDSQLLQLQRSSVVLRMLWLDIRAGCKPLAGHSVSMIEMQRRLFSTTINESITLVAAVAQGVYQEFTL